MTPSSIFSKTLYAFSLPRIPQLRLWLILQLKTALLYACVRFHLNGNRDFRLLSVLLSSLSNHFTTFHLNLQIPFSYEWLIILNEPISLVFFT